MLRKGLVDQVTQHGDDRRAIVVDLGKGSYVDVESVRYDPDEKVIVLMADQSDLEGAFMDLQMRMGVAPSPGA